MSCDESFQNVIFAFESFDWRFELECWDTYAIAFVTKTIAVHHYLWMVVTSFSIWSTKVYDKWFNYCLDDSVFWWSVFSFSHVLRTNVRSTWEKWVCPSDTNKTVEVSWSSALSLLIFRIFACLQAKSIFGAPQNFVTERHLHHFFRTDNHSCWWCCCYWYSFFFGVAIIWLTKCTRRSCLLGWRSTKTYRFLKYWP